VTNRNVILMKWPITRSRRAAGRSEGDTVPEKETEGPVDDFQAEFDKLVQLDQEWRDHFSATNIPSARPPRRKKSASSCSTRSRWEPPSPNVDGSGAETDLMDEQRGIAE